MKSLSSKIAVTAKLSTIISKVASLSSQLNSNLISVNCNFQYTFKPFLGILSTIISSSTISIFERQQYSCKKDIWLQYLLHFYCLFSNGSFLIAFGYPTPQQERDLLILNAMTKHNTISNYFFEDTIMEMISQSKTNNYQ